MWTIVHKSTRVPVRFTKSFLQIMHCRTNHWIVVSTILSHPKQNHRVVFVLLPYSDQHWRSTTSTTTLGLSSLKDLLFDSVDANTTGILKQLFGSKVEVAVNNSKVSGEDRGLFPVASCIC